jgi:hypothetical protein
MSPPEQAAYEKALQKIETCRRAGGKEDTLDLASLGLTVLPPEIGRLNLETAMGLASNP